MKIGFLFKALKAIGSSLFATLLRLVGKSRTRRISVDIDSDGKSDVVVKIDDFIDTQ